MAIITGGIVGDVEASGEWIAGIESTIESILAVFIFRDVFAAIGWVTYIHRTSDTVIAVVVFGVMHTSAGSAKVQGTFVSIVAGVGTLLGAIRSHVIFATRDRVACVGRADRAVVAECMTWGVLASVFWMTRVHGTGKCVDATCVYGCVLATQQ